MANPRSTSESWTVLRVLQWTAEYLRRHGSETPRLDAELLLAHVRGCQRIELYTRFDEELTADERARMRELVQRRARHEPVAYLIGGREFFGLEFHVTRDVFIPRPETETLVMELLELSKPLAAPKVLDVGTGSGCIAVAYAVQRPDAVVVGVDISPAALRVARQNAERHRVDHRVRFLQSDLFEFLRGEPTAELAEEVGSPLPRQFDFIVSNPPYVAENEADAVQPDVRLHEPHQAVFGGPDGLAVIRRLIAEAPEFLNRPGWLLLEISPEQSEAVSRLAAETGQYGRPRFAKDLAGSRRVAVLPRSD